MTCPTHAFLEVLNHPPLGPAGTPPLEPTAICARKRGKRAGESAPAPKAFRRIFRFQPTRGAGGLNLDCGAKPRRARGAVTHGATKPAPARFAPACGARSNRDAACQGDAQRRPAVSTWTAGRNRSALEVRSRTVPRSATSEARRSHASRFHVALGEATSSVTGAGSGRPWHSVTIRESVARSFGRRKGAGGAREAAARA